MSLPGCMEPSPVFIGQKHTGSCLLRLPRRMPPLQQPQRASCTPQHAKHHHARTSWQAAALYQQQVEGSWVTASQSRRPKAVIHFLGGAFAGAAPQLTYALLIQLLAEAGYLVIATPFRVTFFHAECAKAVHQSFQSCMAALQRSPDAWLIPRDGPIHGVGHSNGALLHLLIASMQPVPNASNVIISFSNKQVKQAIPVPLDSLQSLVQSSRSPSQPLALPSPVELLQRVAATAASVGFPLQPDLLTSLTPAVDQIDNVLAEVGNGTMDFVPAPAASSEMIAARYAVPATLLVRFANDAIDETQIVRPLLQDRAPTGVTEIVLPGSHVTPCGSDINWQVGRSFSLGDALGLGAKLLAQADIRRLADRMIWWLGQSQ